MIRDIDVKQINQQKVQLDAKQFYNMLQEYRLALFSSSSADDCVYYTYIKPARIRLDFEGKELCYVLKAEVENDDAFGGLMIKGTTFDCQIQESDRLTSITFKSDMMDEETYLVLKK